MARTVLAKTTALGPYPSLPLAALSADLNLQAADVGNGNAFVSSGNDLLIVQNSGGSPYTVTIVSVADEKGRTGDITTYTVAAGAVSLLGPFKAAGWRQSDNNIYINGSNAAIKFAPVALP